MKSIITYEWREAAKLPNEYKEFLNREQILLLTPVIINSQTLEELYRAYAKLYKKTRHSFTPKAVRYSFTTKWDTVQFTVMSFLHLSNELKLLKNKHGIQVDTSKLRPNALPWIPKALEQVEYFSGECGDVVDELVKTKGSNGIYYGYKVKELFD